MKDITSFVNHVSSRVEISPDDFFMKALSEGSLLKVQENGVTKYFENDIEKGGKRGFIGETRMWQGQEWVKHADGWVRVKKNGQPVVFKSDGKNYPGTDEHKEHFLKHTSNKETTEKNGKILFPNTKTLIGYRNIKSKDKGKYGTFYNVKKPKHYETRQVELTFKNPLIVTDENVYNFEGLSLEYLFWKWFPDLEDTYVRMAKKQGIETGELIDKLVTKEAIKRGYDGIVMADLEIVDLSTYEEQESKIAEFIKTTSNKETTEKKEESKKETKKEEPKDEVLEKFRTLSDEQIRFYLASPHENVKKAATTVLKERGLKIIDDKEYIKGFKDFSKESKEDTERFYKEEASKNPEITFSQERSIKFYTGPGYSDIRDFLTNEDSFKQNFTRNKDLYKNLEYAEYKEKLEGVSDTLSSYIQQNKSKIDLVVNRRVSIVENEGLKEFLSSLKKGDIYEDKSFSSTSLKEQPQFGSFNIRILTKKGSNIMNVNNVGEMEYLIDKGSKFRVIDKDSTGMIVELL